MARSAALLDRIKPPLKRKSGRKAHSSFKLKYADYKGFLSTIQQRLNEIRKPAPPAGPLNKLVAGAQFKTNLIKIPLK
jgi:hypothetical protein